MNTVTRSEDEREDHDDQAVVHELVLRFSGLELARLRELAAPGGCTVEEYVRACVLGPRAPGPVELLAEIMQRRVPGLAKHVDQQGFAADQAQNLDERRTR
jgi:hypothetical protein